MLRSQLGLLLALLYQLCITAGYAKERPSVVGGINSMDFFETQERYRRREMRVWLSLFLRFIIISGVLWVGWLWGQAEQSALQAEADLVVYENNIKINELSNEVQSLKRELAESKAALVVNQVNNKNGEKLRTLIVKKIAGGVTPEQISQSIQALGSTDNCREVARNDIAVATSLFAGQESKLALFEGGLKLFVEGQASKKTTWFDPLREIRARLVFLGAEKNVSGLLPFSAIIVAEDWVLRLEFDRAELLGYVTVVTKRCTLR